MLKQSRGSISSLAVSWLWSTLSITNLKQPTAGGEETDRVVEVGGNSDTEGIRLR